MPETPADADEGGRADAAHTTGALGDLSARRLLTRRRVLATGALGTVGAVAAWSLGRDESTASDEQSGQNARPGVQMIPRSERPRVEPVTGALLGGGEYDSRRDSQASAVVYNVWATWCGPCRKEAPELVRSALSLEKSNVRFVGINLRDNDASAAAFERRYRIPYPSISTADAGQALLSFGRGLPPNAIPMTLVVDRQSRLAVRIIGPTTFVTLRDAVQTVLTA